MRLIETSSLNNQNIDALLLVHTYTATISCDVQVTVFVKDVVGGATYSMTPILNRLGGAVNYRGTPPTQVVPAAITSFFLGSGPIRMFATDVLKVYILGAAGDNVGAADIITEILEPTAVDEDVEGTYSLRDLTRLFASVLLALNTGNDTSTIIHRDLADTKDRVTTSMDVNGNRSAVVLDAT